jgi:hypothetical protein
VQTFQVRRAPISVLAVASPNDPAIGAARDREANAAALIQFERSQDTDITVLTPAQTAYRQSSPGSGRPERKLRRGGARTLRARETNDNRDVSTRTRRAVHSIRVRHHRAGVIARGVGRRHHLCCAIMNVARQPRITPPRTDLHEG